MTAQSGYTWEQIKTKFEAANPILKADANGVDELKAEEITAYLRPNPQFSLTTDGTQIAPHDNVWQPLRSLQPWIYTIPDAGIRKEVCITEQSRLWPPPPLHTSLHPNHGAGSPTGCVTWAEQSGLRGYGE
ncbi:MAG: hypothetical protein ABSA39_17570 [Edaphobacter sp.]